MPIYESRAGKARRLVSLPGEIRQRRQWAESAQRDIKHAEAEGSDPEVVEAHRVLAAEAAEEVSKLEGEYEQLKTEFQAGAPE